MAVLAKTVNQARDDILSRLGVNENDTTYAALVLRKLNESLVDISGEHDWEYLRKHSTLTMSDATGVELLPDDLDRVLAIHTRGEDELLVKVSPLDFESHKENTAITVPTYWVVKGYAQDTSTEAPRMQIEIVSSPSAGTVFQLWYIKNVDEISAGTTTPPLPPYIWSLVQKKALVEGLKDAEKLPSSIDREERRYEQMLYKAKEREKLGSTKFDSIRPHPAVTAHMATRFG